MRRRKKRNMIITIFIVAIVVLLLIFSFFINKINNFSSGQLSVNYNASKNIKATITGSYSINQGEKIVLVAENGDNKIEFNTENTDDILTKKFKKVTNLKIGKDDVLIIEYTIKNNNENGSILLNADADLTKCSNMIVEYSINKIDWRSNIYSILGVNGRIVENSRPINFYIKIYVNEVIEDAKFDGEFNFTLSTQ